MYLECDSVFWGSRRCLFLNLEPAAMKDIRVDHIMKWMHSEVTHTYAPAEGVALTEGEIYAHEMRALASSWWALSHSCSIADLMAACFGIQLVP